MDNAELEAAIRRHPAGRGLRRVPLQVGELHGRRRRPFDRAGVVPRVLVVNAFVSLVCAGIDGSDYVAIGLLAAFAAAMTVDRS